MKSLPVYLAGLILFFAACRPRDARDEPVDHADTSFAGEATPHARDQVSGSEDALTGGPSRLVERIVIGLFERGPEDWFGQISAIAVDRLGRVYVADTYITDVRVFDSAGVYVRSLGRKGRGPGEFLWPDGLTWQNDSTLWVLDDANGRYSVYDTSGVHIKDRRRGPLGGLAPWAARFDGGKLIEPWIASGRYRLAALDPDAPSGTPRDTFPYPLAGVPLNEWNPMYYVQSGTTVRGKKVPFREGFEWSLSRNTKFYDLRKRELLRPPPWVRR